MEEQLSIHPRNWKGGNRKKLNTCAKWKGKGKLAKKQASLNKRRLDHSNTLKSLPSKLNPGAYKTPGSMNQKK